MEFNMYFAYFWRTAFNSVLATARLFAVVLLGLALCAVAVAAYRLYIHPLASVPGPRWAAVSSVWHALHIRNGRVGQLAMTLHQKYGDAVRVGPNEVWFNSKEAFDQIYGTSPDWYCLSSTGKYSSFRVGTCRGLEKSDFYRQCPYSTLVCSRRMHAHTQEQWQRA